MAFNRYKAYLGDIELESQKVGTHTIAIPYFETVEVDYALVAGGGGGGAGGEGGGGGEVQTNFFGSEPLVLDTANQYTIIIGDGGSNGYAVTGSDITPFNQGSGSNGSNSIIISPQVTMSLALGGGGAAGYYKTNPTLDSARSGSNGGSGGGSSVISGGLAIGTGFGNNGGGLTDGSLGGGGGGGSLTTGSDGKGGDGGEPLIIDWLSSTIPTYEIEYLMVGAGGRGGNKDGTNYGGGAGGGQVITGSINVAPSDSYDIIVGNAFTYITGFPAVDGTPTIFNSLTAAGGGKGGSADLTCGTGAEGGDGASGGGAAGNSGCNSGSGQFGFDGQTQQSNFGGSGGGATSKPSGSEGGHGFIWNGKEYAAGGPSNHRHDPFQNPFVRVHQSGDGGHGFDDAGNQPYIAGQDGALILKVSKDIPLTISSSLLSEVSSSGNYDYYVWEDSGTGSLQFEGGTNQKEVGAGGASQGGNGGGTTGGDGGTSLSPIGVDGVQNTGAGGGGGRLAGSFPFNVSNGGSGADGIAVLKYYGDEAKFIGGDINLSGSFVYHTFVSSSELIPRP